MLSLVVAVGPARRASWQLGIRMQQSRRNVHAEAVAAEPGTGAAARTERCRTQRRRVLSDVAFTGDCRRPKAPMPPSAMTTPIRLLRLFAGRIQIDQYLVPLWATRVQSRIACIMRGDGDSKGLQVADRLGLQDLSYAVLPGQSVHYSLP